MSLDTEPMAFPDNLDDCEELAESLSRDIGAIKDELELDAEYSHRDEEWRIRATHAKNFKGREYGKLRLHIKRLRQEQKAARQDQRVESLKAQIDTMSKANKHKIQNIHRALLREQHATGQLFRWIKDTCPDQLDSARSVVDIARLDFDAKTAGQNT